jgi:hypothetical protein
LNLNSSFLMILATGLESPSGGSRPFVIFSTNIYRSLNI